jgi:hypothetical protein
MVGKLMPHGAWCARRTGKKMVLRTEGKFEPAGLSPLLAVRQTEYQLTRGSGTMAPPGAAAFQPVT